MPLATKCLTKSVCHFAVCDIHCHVGTSHQVEPKSSDNPSERLVCCLRLSDLIVLLPLPSEANKLCARSGEGKKTSVWLPRTEQKIVSTLLGDMLVQHVRARQEATDKADPPQPPFTARQHRTIEGAALPLSKAEPSQQLYNNTAVRRSSSSAAGLVKHGSTASLSGRFRTSRHRPPPGACRANRRAGQAKRRLACRALLFCYLSLMDISLHPALSF